MKRWLAWMVATTVFAALEPESAASDVQDALARRAALQQAFKRGRAAIPALVAGLDDPNVVVRRTAVRLLARIEPVPCEALVAALDNDDALVRRTALDQLANELGTGSLDYLEDALQDPSQAVRHAAVRRLIEVEPRTDAVRALLNEARNDDDVDVARMAAEALWEFRRDTLRLSERPDWDYEVQVVQRIPLPADHWRFRVDPRSDGHVEKWFAVDYDDSDWREIAIEQAWQKAGVEYTGVSWYRRWIELPAKPDLNATEIRFEGVDESAWVWINGVYVGDHDIGPEGWNEPFALDITNELTWGERNLIVVRAMNTKGNGGIWRPVTITVLE